MREDISRKVASPWCMVTLDIRPGRMIIGGTRVCGPAGIFFVRKRIRPFSKWMHGTRALMLRTPAIQEEPEERCTFYIHHSQMRKDIKTCSYI